MKKSQTIRRSPHDRENPYVLTARASAQDTRLSYEAAGLLWYLLSLPTDWEVRVDTLRRTKAGRDRIYRMLDELSDVGYVTKPHRVKKPDGTFDWSGYEVHETPVATNAVSAEPPYPEKPDTVEPDTAEPDTAQPDTAKPDSNKVNRHLVNNNKIDTPQNNQQPARTRAMVTAWVPDDQLYDLHGKRLDANELRLAYNELFDTWLDALESCGMPQRATRDILWRQQREGSVSLARARIAPAQLRAYLTEILLDGNSWYRKKGIAPNLETVSARIGPWLQRDIPNGYESAGEPAPEPAAPPRQQMDLTSQKLRARLDELLAAQSGANGD